MERLTFTVLTIGRNGGLIQRDFTDIEEAIKFCKSRSDYQSSIGEYYHYGSRHNYIIRELIVY